MKTIEKLRSICDKHRVTFVYGKFGGEWDFTFCPPIGHVFDSTQCMSICYEGSLKGVIPFIKSEFAYKGTKNEMEGYDFIVSYEDHEYWDNESPGWRQDIKAENEYWEKKEKKNDSNK